MCCPSGTMAGRWHLFVWIWSWWARQQVKGSWAAPTVHYAPSFGPIRKMYWQKSVIFSDLYISNPALIERNGGAYPWAGSGARGVGEAGAQHGKPGVRCVPLFSRWEWICKEPSGFVYCVTDGLKCWNIFYWFTGITMSVCESRFCLKLVWWCAIRSQSVMQNGSVFYHARWQTLFCDREVGNVRKAVTW